MGAAVKYVNISGGGNTTLYYYGIINLEDYMKKSVTVTGKISITVPNNQSGKTTLHYRLDSATAVQIDTVSASSAEAGSVTQNKNISTTINLAGKSKLKFRLTVQSTSGTSSKTGTFSGVTIQFPDVGTEEIITSSKVQEIAYLLNSSVTSSGVIKKSPYATLATAAGSSAFDSTNPKAANLSALITKVNSFTATANKAYNSTSSDDW